MESKNIKIVDEHGIDRTANVICSIDVSGSDYIVYAIERDNENDNIFVSKLIKNIDNTSNLMNIEDSMEKENISNLVKQLTLDAVNSQEDVLSSSEVVLSDGKVVKFITSLINREQSINVQKTYIATVKKSVTKVSTDYYNVKNTLNVQTQENNESVIDSIFPINEDDKSSESLNVQEVVEKTVEIEPIMPTVLEPVTSSVQEAAPQVIIPSVISDVPTEKVEPVEQVKEELPKEPVPVILEPVIEPIIPTVSPVLEEIKPILEVPVSNDVPKEVTPVEEIKPILPVEEPTIVAPVLDTPVTDDKKLVFDASKESNLNNALGEVVTDKVVSVENVEPIREFGIDEAPVPEQVNSGPVLTRTRKAGFANNKFFMVIAITIFFGACVFLGYEAFRYFNLTK